MNRVRKWRVWGTYDAGQMIYMSAAQPDFGAGDLVGTPSWTVMDFTGILDADGREIYEGDILDFDAREWGEPGFRSAVTWSHDEAAWCWGGGRVRDVSQYRRVIGNIFQNVDLLPEQTT